MAMDREEIPARWAQIKAIFNAACGLDTADRKTYLTKACADEAVREEVRSLLAAHDASGPVDRWMSEGVGSSREGVQTSSPEGKQIGPYRVLRELGRGGMGRVYKAQDVRLDRFVALKFLPIHRSADEEMKARLMQEARAASALDHPNICTIYDIGETDEGQLYIAMACYDGETLAEKIEAGPMPVDEALDVARQVAEGLAQAHEAGITHRDVKPPNLMVTGRGTVKILDFGVAKLEGQGTRTQTAVRIGTAAYMAPEQVRGEAVDPRSDLWALGVVLYEMLTGRRPFQASTEAALLDVIQHEDPPPVTTLRPEVPEAVDALIGRLLAKAREDRYQHADALADTLTRLRRRPVPSTSIQPHPLPASLTSFVGREEEIRRVKRLLSTARLVTLTGPAGTGKTRLAVEVATRLQDDFKDGVGFASLASVTDPGLVASAIAQAFDVETTDAMSPLARITHALQGQRMLLVLDNFEQVVAAAPVVTELLAASPTLKVLVTSRIALHVRGEHEFPVPPLGLSASGARDIEAVRDAPSVRLFVERARAVHPDFALTDENVSIVAELCRRLDGLPLAIELAAARVKLFTPRAMLARLERRFDLLKGGPRDAPVRHQTLREAVAWSYQLLNESHQQLFRRIAVCVGGCSLEAIQALAPSSYETPIDVMDGMAELVEHSLVRREAGLDGEPRFTMLETLRAYGIECLRDAGELADVQEQHARHYLDLAEQAAPELTGAAQVSWLDRLEQEHGNLRAALRWVDMRGATEVGLRLGTALWRFWIARGYLLEGGRWLKRLLDMPHEESLTPVRARTLNGLGTIAHNQGDNEEARRLLEESLALWRRLGDEQRTTQVLNNLAWVACEISDLDRAHTLAREAEALCRKLGDRRGIAVALNNLGWVANYRGEYRVARTFHQESLDLRRALGDQRGIAFALANLGWAETYHGDYERAAALLDKALDIAQSAKDRQLGLWINVLQAQLARDRGAIDRAIALLEKSLEQWSEGGNRSIRAWALGLLAGAHVDRGAPDRADVYLHESRVLWETIGGKWGAASVAYEEGRSAQARGDEARARDRYAASFWQRHRLKDRRGMAECLEALSACTAGREAWPHAVRLLAAAHALREAIEAPLPAYRRPAQKQRITALRRKLGNDAFEHLWNEGIDMAPGEAVRPILNSS